MPPASASCVHLSWSNSGLEFELLQGVKQGLIVRLQHEAFSPDVAGFFGLTCDPVDLTQVGRYFCIGTLFESGFQNPCGLLQVANPVFKPTQTVLNEGITRRQLNGF